MLLYTVFSKQRTQYQTTGMRLVGCFNTLYYVLSKKIRELKPENNDSLSIVFVIKSLKQSPFLILVGLRSIPYLPYITFSPQLTLFLPINWVSRTLYMITVEHKFLYIHVLLVFVHSVSRLSLLPDGYFMESSPASFVPDSGVNITSFLVKGV